MGTDFRDEYRSFPTQSLVDIAASDIENSEYRPEAIQAARAELEERGVNWQDEGAEAAQQELAFAWEEIRTQEGPHTMRLYRARLPGGWLVYACEGSIEGESVWNYRQAPSASAGLTYVPDPEHEWDGGTVW